MKLLRVKRLGDDKPFFINQNAVESFGADPVTGVVTIFCSGDSEFGYKVAGTIVDILEQIEP